MCLKSNIKIKYLRERFFNSKLKELSGNILELGFGNGQNFQFYPSNCNITAIDSKIYYTQEFNNIEIKQYTIDNILPFENQVFDYIVFSFFMCSIKNQKSIIKEIHRVLKKQGRIVYLEHITSDMRFYRFIQKLLVPVTTLFFNKCSLFNKFSYSLKSTFKLETKVYIPNSIEPYEFGIWIKHST
ncbi:class I SAM-dependent methyltransferase [Psychroserpens mesophilus]|uniref:class I SAM-dependent methyltransferase n=1 Tax=Psychroserpens mesophilus TaxID=325473 RepID=UPI000590BFA1|nr:methyltransferase domain-containing protein [Psychroserpens mesophilus]